MCAAPRRASSLPLRAHALARRALALAFSAAFFAVLGAGCGAGGESAGSAATGGGAAGASGSGASGGHGCFATEATCGGKCVDLTSSSLHCGACDAPCAQGADKSGSCVDGACVYQCDDGFVDVQGVCKNFFGAHEAFPNDCQGCSTPNPATGMCACPSPSTAISLAVQSDCPGVPLRSSTRLNLCVTPGASPESDFGGAFQVDDLDGWCGAVAQCRVGNPLAGGACACPAGFNEAIAIRSIIRLPCSPDEVGTAVVLCGNKSVPSRSFAGAYQVDDIAPPCRAPNPWTGDCSCPAGAADVVYRVMVDGGGSLYGSTAHLCML